MPPEKKNRTGKSKQQVKRIIILLFLAIVIVLITCALTYRNPENIDIFDAFNLESSASSIPELNVGYT